MKDYLQDIVAHTHALGIIDLVKITGTDQETTVEAIAEDRSVIVQAKFNNPVPEFIGLFGMPNLGKLNTILNIPEYKEDAKITLNTQKVGFFGTPIIFPLSGIPFGTPPPIPQLYTGNTGSGGSVGPSPVVPPSE